MFEGDEESNGKRDVAVSSSTACMKTEEQCVLKLRLGVNGKH